MDKMFTSIFSSGIWAVIKAVLILLLAFITATIVKSLVVKLFTKTKLNTLMAQKDASSGEKEMAVDFIGKLVYLLVFLLFVPGIFENLGMKEVSSPILNLLDTLWGYLPNILAAVLVMWVGFSIARLVRELLIPVFNRIKVNSLQEKAGIQVKDTGRLSNTLAYLVYVLILIPIFIAALQALNIQAISAPAIKMLETIFAFIPNILAALVIIILGCMIAKFFGNIIENLISSTGCDEKLSEYLGEKGKTFIFSKIIGTIIHIITVIFFIVESFGVLHLEILTSIGNAVICYIPSVLAAALILLICYIGNGFIQKALFTNNHTVMAHICKIIIYTIGSFLILNELGIAKELVNITFILIVAALAAAFALSFGIGGKDFAGKALKKLENACLEEHESKK